MIKQLSVFVENRPGSLMDVTSQLTEAHGKRVGFGNDFYFASHR